MRNAHSVGHALKQWRKRRGLTQATLAQQIGCAVSTIKKVEADKLRPSRQLAMRLADFMQIPHTERTELLQVLQPALNSDGDNTESGNNGNHGDNEESSHPPPPLLTARSRP